MSMTLDQFHTLISTYGVSEARWPEAQRSAAFAFMKDNPEAAKRAVLEAQPLDAALDLISEDISPGSDLLRQRILKAAMTDSEPAGASDGQNSSFKFSHIAGMAAMLLTAFSAGFFGAQIAPAQNPESSISVADNETHEWADMADNMGMSDVYQWVESTEAPTLGLSDL